MSDTTRIASLEGRVNEMGQQIAVIEVKVDTWSKFQDKFSQALDKFGDVLGSMNVTMTSMDVEMKLRNVTQKEMKDDIVSLQKSLRLVDDKGKFDFILFAQKKIMPWLMVAGMIYFILDVTKMIP